MVNHSGWATKIDLQAHRVSTFNRASKCQMGSINSTPIRSPPPSTSTLRTLGTITNCCAFHMYWNRLLRRLCVEESSSSSTNTGDTLFDWLKVHSAGLFITTTTSRPSSLLPVSSPYWNCDKNPIGMEHTPFWRRISRPLTSFQGSIHTLRMQA